MSKDRALLAREEARGQREPGCMLLYNLLAQDIIDSCGPKSVERPAFTFQKSQQLCSFIYFFCPNFVKIHQFALPVLCKSNLQNMNLQGTNHNSGWRYDFYDFSLYLSSYCVRSLRLLFLSHKFWKTLKSFNFI